MTPRTKVPAITRAMRFVDKSDPSGCWLWTGRKTKGYGRIWSGGIDGRYIAAHRLIWESVNGPVPEGKECGHRCPTGARKDCVNPDHIEAITHAENMGDEVKVMCRRGLHRLDDPAHSHVDRRGIRKCRTCDTAGYARRRRAKPSVVRVVHRGEQHHHAKLTEESVRHIRSARANGEPIASIARSLGVSGAAVRHVLTGRNWGHIPDSNNAAYWAVTVAP